MSTPKKINWSNLLRPRRRKKSETTDVYDSDRRGAEVLNDAFYTNPWAKYARPGGQTQPTSQASSTPGGKSVDGNAVIGQLGKFYEEYGPSMQYLQKNPGMRGITEAGLDYGMRSLPGVGPAYGAIQDFNQATGGGINIGKAFGLKQDPFKALGNRIFGDPNKNPMTPAEMAIMGRNASRMSGLENAANSDIASSRIEREKLGGQQRNVLDLLTDMANNPQSSRDLASTVGAGVAPLSELASRRMSDSKANIARRGLSGGMATGIMEGQRQASDAGIADIYNRTTLEAMSRRPQMVNMLAGVIGQEQSRLDARDNAARGMIGQIDQQEFARSMSEQQLALDRDRLSAAERASNLQGLGSIAGQFGPDILNEIKRLTKKKTTPLEEFDDNTQGILPPSALEISQNPRTPTFDLSAMAPTFDLPAIKPEALFADNQQRTEFPMNLPPNKLPASFMGIKQEPLSLSEDEKLTRKFVNPKIGDKTYDAARKTEFEYTISGWKKRRLIPKWQNFGTDFGLRG